jgi:2-haloacid dehalogenase
VVTAEDAGAYKPDVRPFELALEAMATTRERVLHVAQSLFHDIRPAKELGFLCVWVNRRAGMNGSGATPSVELGSESRPDMVVPDLRSLVSLMGLR